MMDQENAMHAFILMTNHKSIIQYTYSTEGSCIRGEMNGFGIGWPSGPIICTDHSFTSNTWCTYAIHCFPRDKFLQGVYYILNHYIRVVSQLVFVHFAVAQKEEHSLWKRVVTRNWFNANEPSRVAETFSAIRLIRRRCVIIVGKLRLTWHAINTHRFAGQLLRFSAFTDLRALRFILVVNLHKYKDNFHTECTYYKLTVLLIITVLAQI